MVLAIVSLASEVLVGILAVGIALGLFAWLAPRPKPGAVASMREVPPVDWTAQAGDDFAGLSDAARCDLVFAMAELDDDHSRTVLEAALDDRSDAVALAAAHALATTGRLATVEAYARAHPGPRAEQLLTTTSLLG